MADLSQELVEAVRRALDAGESLRIVGSGSKGALTRGRQAEPGAPEGRLLTVADHQGIVDYRPEELVITARAGTPLRAVERELAQAGQRLGFEPPRFHGGGTLGGAVACGLSGPGRPWSGSVRDALLGVELVNGHGERLAFGGQVMKNVAGYDLSRLQAGAFGTLGLLLSVSLRVAPAPELEETRVFELDAVSALARCRDWARRPYPITATGFFDGRLRVRLAGASAAVAWAAGEIGGELEPELHFWDDLRDHRLALLADGEGTLWRGSLPPAAADPLHGCLVTWAGAERWWRASGADQEARVAEQVRAAGGHARRFDGSFGVRRWPGIGAAELRYLRRLKEAFDPRGMFNPELAAHED